MSTLSNAYLQDLRKELEARFETLQRRVGKIQVHLRHENGPVSADWEEQATERENDEVLEALDDAGRTELAQIKNALSKMDDDTFGICIHCETDIAPARLSALPFTPSCIKCAKKAEHSARTP